jgi:hypothetical protein
MTTPLEALLSIWDDCIPLPYIETVNWPADTDSFPDQWGAVIYQNQQRADVTLGSNPWVEEQGFFLIGLFTRSGKGPADLDTAIAQVRQGLHGAARDGLRVLQVDGPHDVDPEGMGEWWQVVLTAQFIFQTRRSATGPLGNGWLGTNADFDVPPMPPGGWTP